ncbi:MAG: hypothetical protein AVO35_08825 [Candidatus Aegiribacteria sp. MLS_C]|nr:MAG: hypothetical protein AVO35_08825 [Candidatus Aegiribacteria sp. MLS_C]
MHFPTRPWLHLLFLLIAIRVADCDTFTVTGTWNSGPGSLRQAILDANGSTGPDSILFDIPGTGPHTISPTSWLPAFTGRIVIDGYSQPGAARATDSTAAVLMIELNGSLAGSGVGGLYFFTDSDSSRVSGLAVNGFDRVGIYLLNSFGTRIDGNYIGLDIIGSTAVPNQDSGVQVQQTSSNGVIIGGTTPGERNVISGNEGDGISLVNCDSCVVTGNFIGTDASGTAAVPNGGCGIRSCGDHQTIGVPGGGGNLVSGNSQDGVFLQYSQRSTVVSNIIGLDATGTIPLGNGGNGVSCTGDYAAIGGDSAEMRNTISGNGRHGISLSGSTHNSITGNYIGTDSGGIHAAGNHWSGICIFGTSDHTTVGGTGAGQGNLISGNAVHGIDIQGSTGAIVQGNIIGADVHGTSGLGNLYSGVSLSGGADANIVGGTTVASRNIISGNGVCGVTISGCSDNNIMGNFIGTDATGTVALGNGWGVNIAGGSSDNEIGGNGPSDRNLISGNKYGVFISGCSGNLVQGNYIGTDITGTASIPNESEGIYLYDNADGNTIGGCSSGLGNLVSGNTGHGIRIRNSSGNVLQGNMIGTTSLGTGPLGNGIHGILVDDGSPNNTVGGRSRSCSNTIAFNGGSGVCVRSDNGNAIVRNSVFANEGAGIDLGEDGPTPNDPDDPDQGANRLQNYPEVSDVAVSFTSLNVTCSVPSLPGNSAFPLELDFFVSQGDQGRIYLGSGACHSPGQQVISIVTEVPFQLSDSITATSTDSLGNSSEFAPPVHMGGAPGQETPESFDLFHAGDNPGKDCTVIGVSVPQQQEIEILLYDVVGRVVESIMDGPLPAGSHQITVANLVPGVYFCRMRTAGFEETLELVIIE